MTRTVDADWHAFFAAQCAAIRDAGRFRELSTYDLHGVRGLDPRTGRPIVAFASNDYLGLSAHPAVVEAAHEALKRWGAGAGAARLVTGSRPVHDELEADLASFKGTEAALSFPTGYAANLGVLVALGGPDVLVCSDELNHASIVDGCRLSRAEVRVFRHGDLDHLDHLLATTRARRRLVVTDAVFSMDGDEADVAGLLGICARHGAALVLDEAHAVLGPTVPDPGDVALVRVGTCSKALGSLGGFVAGSRDLVALVRNRARSFVFTTALPPASAAAARAALGVLRSAEGQALLSRLRALVDELAPRHPSPILPIVVGDERDALRAAEALAARGLLVPAIRPPTVPRGTSRLRVTLSAAHRPDEVAALASALADLGLREGRAGRKIAGEPGTPARAAAPGRPRRLVAVLGTATDVGKTHVASALARLARGEGLRVAARKPVQSFASRDPAVGAGTGEAGGGRAGAGVAGVGSGAAGVGSGAAGRSAGAGREPTDAERLAAATGEAPASVCPPSRSYPVPYAPPMAAAALGRPPIRLEELLAETSWPEGVDLGLVEGVGGVRSPVADDADNLDLVRALRPDAVVLVAHAGLGTISDVRLATDALAGVAGSGSVAVVLNRYDPDDRLARENLRWLRERDGLVVTTDLRAALAVCLGRPNQPRAPSESSSANS
jgi:8-amino-7-oxononanoate synthase